MQPNRLDAIGMLDCLDERSKGELEKRCRWRRFKAGERIVERNSGDSDVYFVAEGAVRVVNHSMTGREIALARLQRGGYFGEISAIDGLLRSASVVALPATRRMVASSAGNRSYLLRRVSIMKSLSVASSPVASLRTGIRRVKGAGKNRCRHRVSRMP